MIGRQIRICIRRIFLGWLRHIPASQPAQHKLWPLRACIEDDDDNSLAWKFTSAETFLASLHQFWPDIIWLTVSAWIISKYQVILHFTTKLLLQQHTTWCIHGLLGRKASTGWSHGSTHRDRCKAVFTYC